MILAPVIRVKNTNNAMVACNNIIEVAVGVVKNTDGLFLIAKRSQSDFMSELWEFPGGKVEVGESNFDALVREFREEVNLIINGATLLTTITHSYDTRTVELHIWLIEDFAGQAQGLEGQPVRWVSLEALNDYPMPIANQTIVELLAG